MQEGGLGRFILLVLCAGGLVYMATRPQTGGIEDLLREASAPSSPRDRIRVITQGAEVALTSHVERGMVTIVDFYSEGCPPCRALSGPLHQAVEQTPGVALKIVDLNRPGVNGIDWKSPVAKQYGIQSIPYLKVYDQAGQERASGSKARDWVVAWLNDGRRK